MKSIKDEKRRKEREIPILKRSGDWRKGKGKNVHTGLSISSSEPAGEDDHRDQEDSLHYPQQKELEEK